MKKLYLLLAVAFVGFVANAQSVNINYPGSHFCVNSTINPMPVLSGEGNYLGGTFSASPMGLMIHPATGEINLAVSVPGNYVILYSVPASPPDNPAISSFAVITIADPIAPVFDLILPSCYIATLPTVSNNGISGSWQWTQSSVSNVITTTYTFSPNSEECSSTYTQSVIMVEPTIAVITTATGNQTVYVDDNNVVVAPLTLFSGLPTEYTCQWFESGVLILGATSPDYVVNTASVNGAPKTFTVQSTNTGTGCSIMSEGFVVLQSNDTPPPFLDRNQTFPSGATLADIVVSGTNVRWYDSANDKDETVTAAPLPLTTVLMDNATYYASQTINGEESVERNPVTVHLTLGVGNSESIVLTYSPNPVKNRLTLKSSEIIDTISIVNLMGQVLKTTAHNESEIAEDLSAFSAGTYLIRITSGSKTETIKIIKE